MNWTLFSWKTSLQNLDLTTDVCFFGDSITRGGKFQNYFLQKKIVNLGITGDTISGMRERTDMVASVKPKKVFVMAGINDLFLRKTPEMCIDEFKAMYEKLRKSVPDAEIIIQSVLPLNLQKYNKKFDRQKIVIYNKLLSELSDEYSVVFVDLYSEYAKDDNLPEELTVDGVHLYPDSYERWVKKIENLVQRL